MARIKLLGDDEVDGRTAAALRRFRQSWSRDWNLLRVMAHSPALLETFYGLWHGLRKTSLEAKDREVIDLYLAARNGCHYCVPAHIGGAREAGISDDDIRAIIEDRAPGWERGRLILELTRRLVETKGKLPDDEFEAFKRRGASEREMIEVIGEIAHCTFTNYLNRLADTDIDDFNAEMKV